MTTKYLFDASSIIRALKEIRLGPLGGQAIQWLTLYEVLNAIWKESTLLHILTTEEALSLINDFLDLIREMVVLEIRDLERDIIQLAIARKMTVYDASYIALAVKHKLTLVTEDKELLNKSRDLIHAVSLDYVRL
ncbi:MAG: VapC toxin family PIN domain ribonuclease [Thermoproteota archaeon]|jgi:predicted nucleic acid-binding protein|nr:MAG: VapC toxin family PIN domain ribonuclease [Candidatus Korarchaeota archaeon]